MTALKLTVNGQTHHLDVPESRTLAHVLRYDLGLTGTKIGCEEAECGICTVLVNGTPVNSCIYPAFKAQNATITTIEGLAPEQDQLHPLQSAFIEHGAVQCGFCTPGLIMTAKALIDENPRPDEHDIKVALKDTYCRCTGYTTVISAIQSAASELRGDGPIPWEAVADSRTPESDWPVGSAAGDRGQSHRARQIHRRLHLPWDAGRADAARGPSPRAHPEDRHEQGEGAARRAARC